jgi:hypothetical protein
MLILHSISSCHLGQCSLLGCCRRNIECRCARREGRRQAHGRHQFHCNRHESQGHLHGPGYVLSRLSLKYVSNDGSVADWNPITKEEALTSENGLVTYSASKTFAEMALWEWADKHPHVEVTTRTSAQLTCAPKFGN